MKSVRRFFARFSNWATKRRLDERLKEEMEEHLALQTAENVRAGMPPEEARRQALPLRDMSADSVPHPLKHYGLQVAVRMRPGVSDAAAAAEVHTLARTFALRHPGTNLDHLDLNLRDAAHFQRGLFGAVGEQLPGSRRR